MAEGWRWPGRLLIALLVFAVAGCAAGPSNVAAPPPRPLDVREVNAISELLRLADRRETLAPAWSSAVAHSSGRVRRQAALGLARLRRPEGAAHLLRLLDDPDTSVAATAAFGLGLLGDTTVVGRLIPLLDTAVVRTAPSVAAEAAAALGFLRSDASHVALRRFLLSAPLSDPQHGAVVQEALLAAWRFPRPADVPEILRWTDHPDPEIRWRSIYALVRRPTPPAVPLLLTLLDDPHEQVRGLAVRGITAPLTDSGKVAAAAALAAILPALRDPSYIVRVNAVRSVGTFAAPPAVQALTGVLGGPEVHLVHAALEALGRQGTAAAGAADEVQRLAASEDAAPALRQVALEALIRIDPAAGRRVAIGWAGAQEWRLRASAARALATLPPPLAAEWRELARDRDARVAAAAVQGALAAITGPPTVLRPVLVEALGAPDPFVRAAALDGLARFEDPSLLPILLDAYDRARSDPENDAALAAARAISGLAAVKVDPSRAFFARFSRSDDHLVRQLVAASFGDRARAAWGDPLPLEPPIEPDLYRELVHGWVDPASGPAPRVRIETEEGDIDLELYASEAPLTVHSFLSLVRTRYFDGQEWPRVVPNFVVQGGDPRGDTSGGPGYTIRDEINRRRYLTGTLGMALSGPDTGGSQFFITHAPQPHLDRIYTVLGGLVDGQDVLQRILPGQRIFRVRELTTEGLDARRTESEDVPGARR